MIKHLRDVRARRRGEELAESGFTLIELLVVIVVLGILAATVVFALSGVTSQSAQAACNSDAKTTEVAVQAYINSPNNAQNTAPTNIGQLVPNFMSSVSHNDAFIVQLAGDLTPAQQTALGNPAADSVVVATPATGNNWVLYDNQTKAPATGCYGAS